MRTLETIIFLIALTAASALPYPYPYPYPKEGKSEQNSLDYQIDPQLLNYHLQQLLLEQEQQNKQQAAAQAAPQQYSVSQAPQYSAQDQDKYQVQYQQQQQLQDQLNQQLALQYQAQFDGKTAQAAAVPTQAPQSNSLTVSSYQDSSVNYQPSALQSQYQTSVDYQSASPQQYQQYQLASGNEQYQQQPQYQVADAAAAHRYSVSSPTAHQYTQPALEQYQTRQSTASIAQEPRQSLLGVAYSSAVDASKTHFSGYGIKYSF